MVRIVGRKCILIVPTKTFEPMLNVVPIHDLLFGYGPWRHLSRRLDCHCIMHHIQKSNLVDTQVKFNSIQINRILK